MTSKTTIVVSCFEDEPGFTLYCEPEGAEVQITPGDVVTITFAATAPKMFEVSRTSDSLVLCRYQDGEVTVSDKRGRALSW